MTLDTQHFKEKLDEEKELLVKELSGLGVQNPQNPADWNIKDGQNRERADLNMTADVHEDMQERHAVSDELEKRLANVNLALKKIEDGMYGACEIGNKPIEIARLEANPAARTCKEHLNDIV